MTWSAITGCSLLAASVLTVSGAGRPPTVRPGGATVAVARVAVARVAAAHGIGEPIAPARPPARICGNRAMLSGPATPPARSVRIPAGDDAALLGRLTARTTYWLAPGIHTLSSEPFAQIQPAPEDRFVGAPGAILDGRHANLYAFGGSAPGVTVAYLTIRAFGSPGRNDGQGVVNHNSAPGWTISHDTVVDDAGAGVMMGSDDVVTDSCLLDNGQYGVNVYAPNGVSNVTVTHDEIAGNDTDNWERRVPGCGCSGGIKFWRTTGAEVTDDYIHANHDVGLWVDTDNAGFDIADNYISGNYSSGIIYEISYNAQIVANTLVANGLGRGPTNPGFPTGAIYISESGSDPRVPGPYGKEFLIAHNDLIDNWAGVVLWENANRFCNSPSNTSSGMCTLVDPRHVDPATCSPGSIDRPPYFWDCRWRTQRVEVVHNTFVFHPGARRGLGHSDPYSLQGLFSNWGTYPAWSPYKGAVIEQSISTDQHDVWADNVYVGPWRFMVHAQGNVVGLGEWERRWHQDRGSVLHDPSSGSGAGHTRS